MGLISKEKNKFSTALFEILINKGIACFLPGKQGIKNGKQKEQKIILTMTTGEVFRQFTEEYSHAVSGKSKFAKCRPPEVQLSSAMSRSVCNCVYYCNFMLVLDYLHNILGDTFPLCGEKFMNGTVCDIENRQCMTSNCMSCKDKLANVFIDDIPLAKLRRLVSWYYLESNSNDQLEKK